MPHHHNHNRRCPACGLRVHPAREFAHCGCCERLRCPSCLEARDEEGRPVCPECVAAGVEMEEPARA
jgi:hypothetical protein